MPSVIEQVHREFKDRGLVVLAINMGEERATVAAWAAAQGLTIPVLLDPQGTVSQTYQVSFTPTTFLVSANGTLVGKAIGNKSWTGDMGRALLRALLGP